MTYGTSSTGIQRALSLADLDQLVSAFKPLPKNTFGGMKITVSRACFPNRTLSKDVPVSPEFRIEVDKWMLEFFGSEPLIPDGTVYMLPGMDGAICNPNTFRMLKGLTS